MNHEPFARPEQLVGNHQGTDGIIAGAPTGVADDMGIAFREPGVLRRIEARIHAGEDGEFSDGRHEELAFVAEIRHVGLVGSQYFVEDLAHRATSCRSGRSMRRVGDTDCSPSLASFFMSETMRIEWRLWPMRAFPSSFCCTRSALRWHACERYGERLLYGAGVVTFGRKERDRQKEPGDFLNRLFFSGA